MKRKLAFKFKNKKIQKTRQNSNQKSKCSEQFFLFFLRGTPIDIYSFEQLGFQLFELEVTQWTLERIKISTRNLRKLIFRNVVKDLENHRKLDKISKSRKG